MREIHIYPKINRSRGTGVVGLDPLRRVPPSRGKKESSSCTLQDREDLLQQVGRGKYGKNCRRSGPRRWKKQT
ncbi:uncharacterized protein K452DRAFT_283065 [Aplosporella prunicola CBS 121167]|uniref:Uncharacterized protein n=1 Tax=Aplosporella prunicola CBS 121167 TaxID=1176127 RepID=A0A6A6BUG1_9PEZI|nr:uncharacterized protein K452DRAFT_283065 [Aplosporella prunicola CBS 121167]KAF2146864.1 hypothetical protein K452DRAFT_283065 [Aplosporella prunicola CBS 121167]